MSISLRGDRTRRVCLLALFTAFAMMLSYLEVLLPLGLWIPLPGFRLGLANLAVTAVFFLLSPVDAAIVSLTRITLMSLLFGSATSFWFSILGGTFAYLMLLFSAKCARGCSLIGISVLSAAAHNCGQILAATVLFGTGLILSYLPWLLIASIVCGGAVGTLLNLTLPRMRVLWERRRSA